MTPIQQELNQKFNDISLELRKAHDKIKGKSATGLESRYSKAYQNGVKVGIFPQIKAKYRQI